MKLLLVKWIDSFGVGSEWKTADNYKKIPPLYIESVGWEYYRDSEVLVLVSHKTDKDHAPTNQEVCGDMTIPIVCIQKEWELSAK